MCRLNRGSFTHDFTHAFPTSPTNSPPHLTPLFAVFTAFVGRKDPPSVRASLEAPEASSAADTVVTSGSSVDGSHVGEVGDTIKSSHEYPIEMEKGREAVYSSVCGLGGMRDCRRVQGLATVGRST
jgi:hypothetical protein